MNDRKRKRNPVAPEVQLLWDHGTEPGALTASRQGIGKPFFEHEDLYRAVVENIADGIAITAKTERVFVNRAFLTIHGLRDASEVVGHPLDQFVIPEERDAMRQRTLARQQGKPRKDIVEYRIARPDGKTRTVQASVVTTAYKGEPAVLAVLRDVTEMKLAEMKIMQLNEELEQKLADLKNANDELESFNAAVSHDLRTPLMAIAGFSERVAKRYGEGLDEKFREQMGMIRASAAKMERLIEDLLAYSRLGKLALQRAPIEMNALVESVVTELRAVYPEGKVNISSLAPCLGDEGMIREVLDNLLGNAFKFSSRAEERIIGIGCLERAEENVYYVRDNGAGFDMCHKDRLFQPFQRLHREEEFKGTGMGLAIVRKIVGLHAGSVWAEGEPHRGATFYFALPKPGN